MNLVSWNPFQEMENALARIDWPFASDLALTKRTWWPATDIQETATAYVIQTELPGLSKDAIRVRLEDHVLQIEGERTAEKTQRNANANTYHSIERVHGKFLRRFRLPEDIIVAQVQAAYKDGVLKIDLPKKETKNPNKEIKIS